MVLVNVFSYVHPSSRTHALISREYQKGNRFHARYDQTIHKNITVVILDFQCLTLSSRKMSITNLQRKEAVGVIWIGV